MYKLCIVKRSGEVKFSAECLLRSPLKMEALKRLRKTDKAVIFEEDTPICILELNEKGVPTDVTDKYEVSELV